jgi:hypothetical protein
MYEFTFPSNVTRLGRGDRNCPVFGGTLKRYNLLLKLGTYY